MPQFSQQGPKLVGTGATGAAQQGDSVSLSADGNTAIVGGPADNNGHGAAWVYTRSGGVWTQQGSKLVGTGASGAAQQGGSVSLSSDGNTAIVGGPGDNNGHGAAWVYTRSGGVWTQQGNKLVGTGATGAAQQGNSVSLSSDGNTAIVGGPGDNSGAGAAWVYTRSGGVWTQQGASWSARERLEPRSKAPPSRCPPTATRPSWVGPATTVGGAAWVYTRSGGVWTQQGSKLVGTGASGAAQQGASVSLSSDGNTAIVGGPDDNNRGGVGLHAQRRCLDPARKQAGRHGSDRSRATGPLRLAVLRRQHGHRRRAGRQQRHRGCVGLHAQRRCLDPARKQAGRHGSEWSRPTRRLRIALRDGNTAIVGGSTTTAAPGLRGSM